MSAGPCPECGSKDTYYFMMMPVGTFRCNSCNHQWMPGMPEEPYFKFGEDSLVEFEEADAWVQVGYNTAKHMQFFIVKGEYVCAVELFWEGTNYMARQLGAIA